MRKDSIPKLQDGLEPEAEAGAWSSIKNRETEEELALAAQE